MGCRRKDISLHCPVTWPAGRGGRVARAVRVKCTWQAGAWGGGVSVTFCLRGSCFVCLSLSLSNRYVRGNGLLLLSMLLSCDCWPILSVVHYRVTASATPRAAVRTHADKPTHAYKHIYIHNTAHYTHLSYLSPPFLCVSMVTTSACYFLLTYSYHSTNSHHAPTQWKLLTFTLCTTFPHLVVAQLYVSCSCAWQLFFEYWLSGTPTCIECELSPLR